LGSRPSRCSGRRATFSLLIVGEVRRGKTRVTEGLVRALVHLGLGHAVTVLDFAPNYRGVGTPMSVEGARVLRPPRLYAPRLMGRRCDEVWRFAELNARETTALLNAYIRSPTPVLVINDLTIHLHAGDPGLLYEAISRATLFIGNAYYGEELRDECGLWRRERRLVEELMERVDAVWRL